MASGLSAAEEFVAWQKKHSRIIALASAIGRRNNVRGRLLVTGQLMSARRPIAVRDNVLHHRRQGITGGANWRYSNIALSSYMRRFGIRPSCKRRRASHVMRVGHFIRHSSIAARALPGMAYQAQVITVLKPPTSSDHRAEMLRVCARKCARRLGVMSAPAPTPLRQRQRNQCAPMYATLL